MTFTFPTRRQKRISKPYWLHPFPPFQHIPTATPGLRGFACWASTLEGVPMAISLHWHPWWASVPHREGNEGTVNCGSCGKILLRCGWRLKGEESRVGTLQSVCFARDYPVGYTLPTSELELVFGVGLQYPCKCKAEPHCDRASEDFIMIE